MVFKALPAATSVWTWGGRLVSDISQRRSWDTARFLPAHRLAHTACAAG